MIQATDFKSESLSITAEDGVRIFFEVNSPSQSQPTKKYPLFLINGHTRSGSDFKVLSRKLVQKGFETIAVDNRNSGKSICNHDYTFDVFSTDIIRIMDELDYPNACFLGISMGGAIVQRLASKFQDRVTKAIVVSSFVENQSSKPSIPWGDSLESVKAKLSKYFAPEYSKRNHLILEAMSKQILDKIKNGSFTENAARQRLALKNIDLSKELSKVRASCLIVHGTEDQIIPLDQSLKMSKLIPNNILKTYEGVGHLILAEKPDLFFQDILEFLQ